MLRGIAKAHEDRPDSLIGAKTCVEGNVCFVGGLRLEGRVYGRIRTLPEQPGTLIVSEQACIRGEVAAPHLVVNGTIDGQVAGFETLELQSSARVSGDVTYNLIEIRHGAIVEGRLVHRALGGPKQGQF